jgi:hypothetical protein
MNAVAVATQPLVIMKQLSENLELICFRNAEGVALDDGKIAIPDAMLDTKLVNWTGTICLLLHLPRAFFYAATA